MYCEFGGFSEAAVFHTCGAYGQVESASFKITVAITGLQNHWWKLTLVFVMQLRFWPEADPFRQHTFKIHDVCTFSEP
jgi:hypothetical protein